MKKLFNKIDELLDKFISWINYGGRNKHLIISIIIYLILLPIFVNLELNIYISFLIVTIIDVVILIIKELYDKYIKHTFFDYTDIIAGMIYPICIWLSILIYFLINLIKL